MAAIVYVTTNLVTGKRYLGKHNGKNPEYLGSGLAIKAAIKKYGKSSFIREVVAEVATDQEAFSLEEELSKDWNVVEDPDWYNMKVGGKGFSSGVEHPQFGKPRSTQHTRALVASRIGWRQSEESKEKIRVANTGKNNSMFGLRGTEHPAHGHGAPGGPKGPHKNKRRKSVV